MLENLDMMPRACYLRFSAMEGCQGTMAADETFSRTVKNLLNMKPKPHDEDSGDKSGQPDSRSDQSSSKRATKLRNSGED